MVKKAAPETAVMTRTVANALGFLFSSAGNIGYAAPYISQKTKARMNKPPRINGTSVWADFQE
jgi:hypothetical protein